MPPAGSQAHAVSFRAAKDPDEGSVRLRSICCCGEMPKRLAADRVSYWAVETETGVFGSQRLYTLSNRKNLTSDGARYSNRTAVSLASSKSLTDHGARSQWSVPWMDELNQKSWAECYLAPQGDKFPCLAVPIWLHVRALKGAILFHEAHGNTGESLERRVSFEFRPMRCPDDGPSYGSRLGAGRLRMY